MQHSCCVRRLFPTTAKTPHLTWSTHKFHQEDAIPSFLHPNHMDSSLDEILFWNSGIWFRRACLVFSCSHWGLWYSGIDKICGKSSDTSSIAETSTDDSPGAGSNIILELEGFLLQLQCISCREQFWCNWQIIGIQQRLTLELWHKNTIYERHLVGVRLSHVLLICHSRT